MKKQCSRLEVLLWQQDGVLNAEALYVRILVL